MNSARRATALAALVLLAPVAFGQPGADKPAQPPAAPTTPPPPPPPPSKAQPINGPGLVPVPLPVNPPFARLGEMGPDGKIKRVDGILDILAIQRNSLIDDATREKIRPLVKAWMADVDQLTIDNLDFMEKIEPSDGGPGVIEKTDINDMKGLHYVAQMMTQLMSTGPLSAHLETKEGFTRDQSQRNQEIVSDYLQQVMNEIMAANGTPNDIARKPLTEDEKVRQVNAVSRFLYYVSCRDTLDSFHRQLASDAPLMSKAVAKLDLSADEKSKLSPALAQCEKASTVEEKRKASRAVLDALSFDHQRAAMQECRDMAPPYDPIAELGPPIPPPPNAGQPAAAAPQPTAPVYTPPKTEADKSVNK